MKISREYLCFIFCIALTMSSCPNNCNNHGSCNNNVCECDQILGSQVGNYLMYVGADCSSCPMGVSFANFKEVSSVGPEHDNGIGTSRLLSNSSSSERVSIRLLSAESGIKLVSDMKIEYVSNNIGLFACYDLLNNYVGKLVLYGKNVTFNEYYVKPEFEDEISENEIVCKLIEKFDDLSLYYVSTIEEASCNTNDANACTLTMKGMKEVTEINEFKFNPDNNVKNYNFLCDGQTTPIQFVESVVNDDIVFKNAAATPGVALTSGTTCRLLAKVNNDNTITDSASNDITKDNCLYCKLPKLDDPIKNTNYRKITGISITLGENNFGIFDVYHKYSGDYLGRSNIYHSKDSKDDNYYIKYDFNITTAGNIIDYKYELVEKNKDISLLISTKVDDGCKIVEGEGKSAKAECTITVNNINTILGLADGYTTTTDLTFACMNSSGTITEYGKWSGKVEGDGNANIKFTIADSEKVPNPNDECHLLAKVGDDSGYKLSAVYLKDSFYYMKNNENTKIQFEKVKDYGNIYKADIKYTMKRAETTGSILLCNNGRIIQEVIYFHEEKSGEVNTIYVSTRNNGILSGSYTCSVSRLLNDYSLINPITVSTDCKAKDKCELKWEGMSVSGVTGDVNLACENQTGLITIYQFKVDKPSRRLLTDLTDIILQPSDDKTKIPNDKDICHILLKPAKDEITKDTLKDSDYGKELGTSCIEPSIEINKRNKQSKVYEVMNYDIILPSSSYIGKLYCQLGNGLIGDAYLMGKVTGSENHYYILYDFDYNNNPKPNDYICILTDSYNDLSVFNEVKVLGQGVNGGVCYDKKCDIVWKNMNTLLSAVNLGDKISTDVKKVSYMVCTDRLKNVKLYEYTGSAADSNITFSLVNDKPYPKVGDSCSLLSDLEGNAIESGNKYKSLYNSIYYKKNSEYNYPQLLDYNYTAVGTTEPKIYRVKGLKLDDKSFTVGLLKCFEKGVLKGTATVFGIKDDYTYIKYDFLSVDVLPVPSEYSYVIVKKYTDLSLLLTGKTTKSDDVYKISFSDIKSVIEEFYPEVIESKNIKFVCSSSPTTVYESAKDMTDKFVFKITGDGLTEASNCYMLNYFNGEVITTIESSQYGKSPRLQSSTEITTIKTNIKVYSILNMNGFGELECYKKDGSKVTVTNYGISKEDPKVNYVSFEGDITDYYDCNYTKIYNDYSFYPSITTTEDKCTTKTASKCELTWEGMKPIIEGIGLDNKPLQFKCTKDVDDIYLKLTTDKLTSTSKTSSRILQEENPNNDLLLYLSEDDKDANLPTENGYNCKLYIYSNGTNINYDKLPKIIKEEIEDDKIFIYSVSNVDFKNEKGVGYKTCKVNGEIKTLVFMGKKDTTRYIKFDSKMTKGQYLLLECDYKETIYNDLSFYYNITIPEGSCKSSSCTLAGMYPLLQSVGFFDDNGENTKEYSLACEKGNDYIKYDKFKFAKDSSSVGKENDVTIVYSGSDTIDANSVCHLLSKFDGTEISDETDSDYVKNIIITSTKSFGGRNIYIVKNLKNDLKNKIGELKCINKNTKLPLGTAYLMGYSDTDDKGYYIDYSFTSTPTPYSYDCTLQKEYKDLSLLYEIVYDGSDINVGDIFKAAGIKSLTGNGKNVVCKNSLSSKITLYTVTYNGDLKFSDTTPQSQDKCSLLIDTKGNTIELVKSDYGKFYGIKENPKDNEEIVAVKVDTTPKVVKKEEIEIPSTIPSSGNALIKCYDKETNEYLGDGEILGENANGEVIIKYYFGNNDGSSIEPSLLDIIPTVIRNDYSTTRTPKIDKEDCKGEECITVWSEMKQVLIGLLSSSSNRMRNLVDNCYGSSALDKSGKEINVNICDNGVENSNDLIVKVTDESVEMKKGDSLYPLVNRVGRVSPQSSEAYKLLKTGSDSIEFDTTAITNMNKVKKFLFNDVKFDTRQLYPGNTIIMTLKLSSNKDTTPTTYTITGVEKNYVDSTETPRLLNEDARILTEPNTYAYAVSVSEWKDLEEDQTQITVSFPGSGNSGSVNKLIECSGAGTCDRESGECKCYNGFTGSACERMDCPNKCNKHGKCVRISELMNEIPSGIFGNTAGEEKIFGCKCDSGYRGADCSLKECPSDITKVSDRDCSNHGLCDYGDGSCKCFDGYFGEACQHSVGTV